MQRPVTYSEASFNHWRAERVGVQPYFRAVYPNIDRLLKSAGTILDIAGGDGHTHDMLAPDLSARLTTVDSDPAAIQRLTDRYPRAEAITADANKLPFADESFDAAISITGFGGFVGSDKAAKEIERVLKPGGIFVFLQDRPANLDSVGEIKAEEFQAAGMPMQLILPLYNKTDPQYPIIDQLLVADTTFVARAIHIGGTATRGLIEPILKANREEGLYFDSFNVAAHAKRALALLRHFDRLKDEVGPALFSITDPLAPVLDEIQLGRLEATNMQGKVQVVEVATELPDVHYINGKPVEKLYVDALSFPHVSFAKSAETVTATKIAGRTPVYIGQKP